MYTFLGKHVHVSEKTRTSFVDLLFRYVRHKKRTFAKVIGTNDCRDRYKNRKQ